MKIQNIDLMPWECEALLAAIRRDYRVEFLKAHCHTAHTDFHQSNVRMAIRLLEILNPKRQLKQEAVHRPLYLKNEESDQFEFANKES